MHCNEHRRPTLRNRRRRRAGAGTVAGPSVAALVVNVGGSGGDESSAAVAQAMFEAAASLGVPGKSRILNVHCKPVSVDFLSKV